MGNSINTNYGAAIALQTLNATAASLNATQNRISTGLKVADARDDSAAWSVAQTMRSQNLALNAVTDSLNRGVSTLGVANTAGSAISDLLTQMQSTVAAASDNALDDASRASYQQKYQSLAQQVKTYLKNASFNGVNMLDGTTKSLSALANADGTSTITAQGQNLSMATGFSGGQAAVASTQLGSVGPASISSVMTLSQASSFNVTSGATSFSVNLAAGGYTAAQLVTAVNTAYTAAGGTGTIATQTTGTITLTTNANNESLSVSGGTGDLTSTAAIFGGAPTNTPGAAGAKGTYVGSATVTTGTGVKGMGLSQDSGFTLQTDDGAQVAVSLGKGYYSNAQLVTAINNAYAGTGKSGTIASVDGSGKLKLTGVDTTNPVSAASGDFTNAAAAKTALGLNSATTTSYTQATSFTENGGGGVITVSGSETFTSGTNYADLINKLKASISNVSSALGSLGTASNAMTNHITFVGKLQDSLTAGVGNLVDADVAKESANLTALQTKQQLGVQALSIANSSSSTLLSLFR